MNKCWINIKVKNIKKPIHISCCFVEMLDKEESKKRTKNYFKNKKLGNHKDKFLRELPDRKYWEGDIVKFQEKKMMIVGVDYWDEKKWYNISDNFGCGYYKMVQENNIELIERGNIWKHYHNENIEFKDLKDETNFNKLICKFDNMKNPRNDLYKWTLEETLESIREGYVDGFSVGITPLVGTKDITAIKFHDRELGKRVGEATLKGFNN